MKCKHIIQNIDASADIILYGSRARGDAYQESDYDLLILTDNIANMEKEDIIRRQLFPIEIETGAVITISNCHHKIRLLFHAHMFICHHYFSKPLSIFLCFNLNKALW